MNEYLECVIKISKWMLMIIAVLFAGCGVIIGCGKLYYLLSVEYGTLLANVIAWLVILVVLVLFFAWVMLCDRICRRERDRLDDNYH